MKKVWPILFIAFLVLVISFLNYKPGTYLSGWDNLHPEFNFSANINRSLYAVWQEYQGLGLLGGMAHAADLPRQLFLWLFSNFLPNNFLRYFYHFSMLLIGSVGIYLILNNLILKSSEDSVRKKASLLGSLFYIFNLGTIQYFFVPFEPFSTFFAFFPWEIYVLLNYLNEPSRKNLWFLMMINILAIPQAYVQITFLVYLICVFTILIISYLRQKGWERVKQSLKVLAVIFLVNAFWILPSFYFIATNISVPQEAIQNQLSTEKFYHMNQARGTIFDFAILREFYYDFFEYNQETNKLYFLMEPWRNHFSSPIVLFLGYIFFALVVFGLTIKNPYRVYLLSLFGICSIVFLSGTPGLSVVNDAFRSIPIINQIFRTPFTKFIVPTIFLFSISFALSMAYLLGRLREVNLGVYRSVFMAFVIGLLIIGLPIFKTHLFADQLRVKIPQDYFELFTFFNHREKDARIMNLPQSGFWGWNYYKFGTFGSGFIWYGTPQPIMDRAFDVWSNNLEEYYWQLNLALNKKDEELFNQILEKYDIKYVLLDENLFLTSNPYYLKAVNDQKDLLLSNNKLEKVGAFGKITVYRSKLNNRFEKYIGVSRGLPKINKTEQFSSQDLIFAKYGFYLSNGENNVIYPLGSLFTQRFQDEQKFDISGQHNQFVVSGKVPAGNYSLNIPSIKEEPIIPIQIFARNQSGVIQLRFESIIPKIKVGEKDYTGPSNIKDFKISSNELALILNINNTDYFPIGNLTEDFKLLGSTYIINSQKANYFKVYSDKSKKSHKLGASDFKSAKECADPKGENLIYSSNEGDTLMLRAKNNAVCSVYKEEFSALQNSLVGVSFIYNSLSDEYPQYCLFSQNLNSCINKKDEIRVGFSNDMVKFSDFAEYGLLVNDNLSFSLILEALNDANRDQTKEISYKDILLTFYPLVTFGTLEPEDFTDSERAIKLSLSENQKISVTVPKIFSSLSINNHINLGIYKKSPLNFNPLFSEDYGLEEGQEKGSKFIRLKAKHTSSNIIFRNNYLNPYYGYILDVKSRNIKNFPFIVNVFTDKDLRNYVYTYPKKQDSFTSSFYILPPIYEFDKGMNVLLENSSYNNIETVNDVADISLYPLPYRFLTNINLVSEGFTTGVVNPPQAVYKHNTSSYDVGIASDESKTLVMSQSFDIGWKAYKVSEGKTQIASFVHSSLPFLFGKKVGEHVLVNGWANGWILDGASKDERIVILYLPQYLEYIGFLLFSIGIGWVTFSFIKDRWLTRIL